MNKRSVVLKQIASCADPARKPSNSQTPFTSSIGSMNQLEPKSLPPIAPQNQQSSTAIANLITAQIERAALILDMSSQDLESWLDLFPGVPTATKLSLLHIITRSNLNPFLEEVVFSQYTPQKWEAMITVNGWSTLINRSSVFGGVSFEQGPDDEHAIPTWMECSIYRLDRALPMIVREYFAEVKVESEMWQKIPRRMLRHKVFAQCARLAFGI